MSVPRLAEALADSPVVLIHGPRQCGKTTLARQIGQRGGYAYFTFDDAVALAAAESDPVAFVADLPDRAILDEVQRVPAVFTAIKAAVDRRRTPGRFLLTGSANVLLVPGLADSLAGRMEIVRLHPLAQAELAAAKPPMFLDALFRGAFKMRTSPDWRRSWPSESRPAATPPPWPGPEPDEGPSGTATTSRPSSSATSGTSLGFVNSTRSRGCCRLPPARPAGS